MTTKIPVFKPYIGTDTVKAVIEAFDTGWLGMGSLTKEFEDALAEYLGLQNRYLVAVNTGTSALHLAMLLAGVRPGDEVITPSFNSTADFQAILAAGAEPVFCDIREDNLGIDCDKAESLISPRTKAILGMDYAGIACDLTSLHTLAQQHDLRVIHDAAHSFGTRFQGQLIGSFGDTVIFGFDHIKTLTCIDGGALVVNSEDDAERLRSYRLLGIKQSASWMYSNSRPSSIHDIVSQGFRYHLSNVHAAVGLSQLTRFNEFIANRQRYCQLYSSLLIGTEGLQIPHTDFVDVAPFIYYLRVKDGLRTPVMSYLGKAGIETGIQWTPAHNSTLLQNCRKGDLSITETVGSEIMSLPLHSYMDVTDIERVVSTIKDSLRQLRND